MIDRRSALQLLAASVTAACTRAAPSSSGAGGSAENASGSTTATAAKKTMPVIFLAHGAPPLLDDAGWMGELSTWAKRMPRPESILMLSAHWDSRPARLGATTTVPLVYDFYGFPQRYYETKYPAPGAPALAARIRALLDRS